MIPEVVGSIPIIHPSFLESAVKALFVFLCILLEKSRSNAPAFCTGWYLIWQGIFRQGNHEIVHFTIHAVPTGIKEDSGEILVNRRVRL